MVQKGLVNFIRIIGEAGHYYCELRKCGTNVSYSKALS